MSMIVMIVLLRRKDMFTDNPLLTWYLRLKENNHVSRKLKKYLPIFTILFRKPGF